MGGNALSHTSVRLTKSNYTRVAVDVVARLKALYPGNRVYAIESYRAKADFGDLDVLVESTGYDPHQAAAALGAVEVVRNGPVTSVGLVVRPDVPLLDGNVFQVDLIKTGPAEFDFASCYFRNSDMGNLVGRVAHAMYVALRHDGLVFYFRDGDYLFRDIVLTRDYREALAFLGYAPDRFFEGFEDLEEIFQYVSSTPFFNRDIFLLENRNAQARVRDRKRPTYNAFLKWCEVRPELPAFEFPKVKTAWLSRIAEFFPSFQAEYDRAIADLAELRAVKAKFNGDWVSELTGLEGQGLGVLMRRFKESFETPEAMRAYLLATAPPDIEVRVRRVLSQLNEDGLSPMWTLLEAGAPVEQVRDQVERHLTALCALPAETAGVASALAATRGMLGHMAD